MSAQLRSYAPVAAFLFAIGVALRASAFVWPSVEVHLAAPEVMFRSAFVFVVYSILKKNKLEKGCVVICLYSLHSIVLPNTSIPIVGIVVVSAISLVMLHAAAQASRKERYLFAALIISSLWASVFEPLLADDVNALSRRLVRLASMAGCALPTLALLYEPIEARFSKYLPALFALGALGLHAALMLAGLVHPLFKYLTGPTSNAVMAAVALTFWIRQKSRRDTQTLGWLVVLLSMTLGALVGSFAFEGPLPAPSGMQDYALGFRALLRGFHIDIMIVGAGLIIFGKNQNRVFVALALVLCFSHFLPTSLRAIGLGVLALVFLAMGFHDYKRLSA